MSQKTKKECKLSEEREAAKVIFMSRVQEFEQGEKSTRYFYRVAMKNFWKSNIFKLNINGKEITDSKEIMTQLYQAKSWKSTQICVHLGRFF